MFDGRQQHKAHIIVAALLGTTGIILIVISLFRMYVVTDACYGPFITSCAGALLFLAGIALGAYIKRRMTP